MPERGRKSGDGAARAAPRLRPFWSGVITFGLVSVPVELYAANRSSRVSLRMVAPDGTPLRREYWCPEHDRPVDSEEIVRGYELDSGEFVVVRDEELERLEPEKSREIDLRRFVPVSDLDPAFYQRAYFLAPGGDTTKAYRLLAETMERSGRAGIATFVMRGREYLIAILSERGILRAETMRFHDELRSPEDVGLPEPADAAADQEAVSLLERAIRKHEAEALEPAELEDEYAERMEKLVARKVRAGEGIAERPEEAVEAAEGAEGVIDILEVLKERMRSAAAAESGEAPEDARPEATRSRRAGERPHRTERPRRERRRARAGAGSSAPAPSTGAGEAGGPSRAELRERTKGELYERAKELEIPGRSKMSKGELVEAIRRAG